MKIYLRDRCNATQRHVEMKLLLLNGTAHLYENATNRVDEDTDGSFAA